MRRGIDIHYFTPDDGKYDLNQFEEFVSRLKPEIVYIESISNPMLIVADVADISKSAKKHGAKVIVDNTFATPWLYKPLDDNTDIVIHSATKYFSGHGNLTAGVLCGNDHKIMQSAIEYRKFIGHMISPDDAYRLQTQMQSFDIRFSHQCDNAYKLAERLIRIPVIDEVWYPGLKNHTTHLVAEKLFDCKGYGAMITFTFKGKDNSEKKNRRDTFIKLVSEKIKLIPSLGDQNTILMPVEAVWGTKYPDAGMIRLSIGFEDYARLEMTIAKAFSNIV